MAETEVKDVVVRKSSMPRKRKQEAAVREPSELLHVIAQAVVDPRMDVEKMGKLLDMHGAVTTSKQKPSRQRDRKRRKPTTSRATSTAMRKAKSASRASTSACWEVWEVPMGSLGSLGFSQISHAEVRYGQVWPGN